MTESSEKVVGLLAEVWLDGTDVSVNLKPYLTNLSYKDFLKGDATDSIEVTLEDTQGLFRDKFYPKMSAELRFKFGFDKQGREIVFESGYGFLINKITTSGPPDIVRWTAIGQLPGKRIHENKNKAWVKTTLKGIAGAIAKNHDLGFRYESDQEIPLERVDQIMESDFRLLKRLAATYGLVVSLKSGKDKLTLVMTSLGYAMSGAVKYEIVRESVVRYSFDEDIVQGKGGVVTRFFDKDLKKLIETEAPGDGESHRIITVGVKDALQAHVHGTKDNEKKEGQGNTMTLPGNPRLVAGAMVGLTGWGRYDGEWLITESEHTMDAQGGYQTKIKIARES